MNSQQETSKAIAVISYLASLSAEKAELGLIKVAEKSDSMLAEVVRGMEIPDIHKIESQYDFSKPSITKSLLSNEQILELFKEEFKYSQLSQESFTLITEKVIYYFYDEDEEKVAKTISAFIDDEFGKELVYLINFLSNQNQAHIELEFEFDVVSFSTLGAFKKKSLLKVFSLKDQLSSLKSLASIQTEISDSEEEDMFSSLD